MKDRNWLGTAFKALSDPIRYRMLRLLAINNAELCVCEFVDALQELSLIHISEPTRPPSTSRMPSSA